MNTPENYDCILQDTARANGGRGDAFHEAVHEVQYQLPSSLDSHLFCPCPVYQDPSALPYVTELLHHSLCRARFTDDHSPTSTRSRFTD